jgi:hypothetical protein
MPRAVCQRDLRIKVKNMGRAVLNTARPVVKTGGMTLYRVLYTLTNGSIHLLPNWFDEEWAGRIAHQLRQCPDVASVEIIAAEMPNLRQAA